VTGCDRDLEVIAAIRRLHQAYAQLYCSLKVELVEAQLHVWCGHHLV